MGKPEPRLSPLQPSKSVFDFTSVRIAIIEHIVRSLEPIVQRITTHTNRRGTKMAAEEHTDHGAEEGDRVAEHTAVPRLLFE